MKNHIQIYIVIFFCLFLCGQAISSEEKRVALVIGNSDYKKAPLRNPKNDATDVAKALEELGFTVHLTLDADQGSMQRAIRDFNKTMKDADVRFFYYAGHGVSVDGDNYMIPLAADIQTQDEVQFEAVKTSLVLNLMEKTKSGANILVLDACRDNPLPKSTRSSQAGLAKMQAPVGSMVLYATAPGQVALDGSGRNGTFTKHLLRSLTAPGVHVGDIALDVRVAVMQETGNQQVPWSESSLTRRIYLAGENGSTTQSAQPDAPQALSSETSVEYESSILAAYASAAEAGDPVAQARLGYIYDVGRSIPENNEKAILWYKKAAANQEWSAVVNMAVMHLNGDGVPVDVAKAFSFFEQAAKAGHPVAQRNLGSMYQYGEHVKLDISQALYWFELAAKQGNTEALVDIGDIHSRGLGVPVNNTVAFNQYMKAALQGSAQAQSEIGYFYDQGIGVPKNYSEAFKWFQQAAAQDHPTGIYNLGESYELGKGVVQDLERSKELYKRAAVLGETAALQALERLGAGE